MPTYSSRLKNKTISVQNYLELLIKVLAILLVLFIVSKHKSLIVIAVFEILDIAKNLLKKTLPFIPLDLVFVFGLTASYYYSPWIAVLIFGLGILNRILLLSIELRHVAKFLRHFIFFFTMPLFRHYPFFSVAFVMLFFNYVLKYGFKIAQGELGDFDKAHFHITNFTGASIMFYLIYTIYSYLPFLA